MKHTQGNWLISTHADNEDIVIRNDKGIIANLSVDQWDDLSQDEIEANAMIIVEAANIAHKTGKTPRQLADENKQLLEALQYIKDETRKAELSSFDTFEDQKKFLNEIFQTAREAINKALNQ